MGRGQARAPEIDSDSSASPELRKLPSSLGTCHFFTCESPHALSKSDVQKAFNQNFARLAARGFLCRSDLGLGFSLRRRVRGYRGLCLRLRGFCGLRVNRLRARRADGLLGLAVPGSCLPTIPSTKLHNLTTRILEVYLHMVHVDIRVFILCGMPHASHVLSLQQFWLLSSLFKSKTRYHSVWTPSNHQLDDPKQFGL